MKKIDFEIDDFMNYCDYKGLLQKNMKSYEQTLRTFVKYSYRYGVIKAAIKFKKHRKAIYW